MIGDRDPDITYRVTRLDVFIQDPLGSVVTRSDGLHWQITLYKDGEKSGNLACRYDILPEWIRTGMNMLDAAAWETGNGTIPGFGNCIDHHTYWFGSRLRYDPDNCEGEPSQSTPLPRSYTMIEFTVELDVPRADNTIRPGRKPENVIKFPLGEMPVNASFLIPIPRVDGQLPEKPLALWRRRFAVAKKAFLKNAEAAGQQFRTGIVDGGLRVWRTE